MNEAFETWYASESRRTRLKKEEAKEIWNSAVAALNSEAIDLLEEISDHGLTITRVKRARTLVTAYRGNEREGL
jgi:hypothetical protein